ncbi:J domain-containing protein [Rhodococcus opacus]|uniref:J domain-containing protein n=1 Tax=Rhodococcus opacus TaxID=37919 RepID=UPI0007CD4607|nr:J domain-containing protein [Rhodococcus opacus]MDX5970130.1 J domain-containing protein [Rhodococcus opacus]NKY75198.1 J domain-containing protein [Rhodococcus opacus]CAG7633433.1 Chaperone protein DnaJ [Rhodococcus opacus]
MANERDPYQVLGLSSSASQAEIASAYRRLLRDHHPDTRTHHHTPDPAADEYLQRILSAYAQLRDPAHRAAPDPAAADPAAAEPDAQPRRPPRSPTPPAAPTRIHVVVRGTPPPRRPPATGLWVSPVRWHR